MSRVFTIVVILLLMAVVAFALGRIRNLRNVDDGPESPGPRQEVTGR